MAFIDEMTIKVEAGKGGDGVVRWRHVAGKEYAGPSGGNGGRGGSVFVVAVRNLNLLSKYKHKKKFKAEDGEAGGKNSLEGANGENLEIALPIGSIITNLKTGQKIRLDKEGERALILEGGFGGRGNESFKSSVNRSPKESTKGKPGEEASFFIEVELIAEIGLIGLPNAGKSSLLNELTNAKAKIGDYPFTTLEPNLGEYFGHVIADIPGLIEGAGGGKGLGHKFLKHIRRTKILVHLISLENENILETYQTIRQELEKFDKDLTKKKEIIVLSKSDLDESGEKIKKAKKELAKISKNIQVISLLDEDSIKNLGDFLISELKIKS